MTYKPSVEFPRPQGPTRERRAGLIARVAGIALASGFLGFVVGEASHGFDFGLPHFGLPSPDFGATPPRGQAQAKADTYEAVTELIQCSDEVTADIGVKVSSREFFISGYEINHTYPFRVLVCGPKGFELKVNETKDSKGLVTKVQASEASYVPVIGGVDFNNGVFCEGNSANASASHIQSSLKTFDRASKHHQVINCDFGEGTTGLNIVSDKVPAQDEAVAGQIAQDAGEISPIPAKVYKKIIQDAYTQAENQLKNEFPKAEIGLTKAAVPTDVEQIKANWQSEGTNIAGALISYSFANVDGHTEFKVKSMYDGGNGEVIMPHNLSNSDVNELNHYTHEPIRG